MSERPFRRVVLICDAACDIRIAVTDAAALAARWGAALHGVYLDDENLHRFAGLPFGQPVSLSSAAITQELTASTMLHMSAALRSGMKRALADAATARGLQWTFVAIRDLPSAASVLAQEGDILVVEAAARAFSGAWRPRAAWEKSPASFSGTVLLKGRGGSAHGILALLPEDKAVRERILSASAGLATGDDEIILVSKGAPLADAEAAFFQADQRRQIIALPLGDDPTALTRLLARISPAVIVLPADDAAEWLEDTTADILFVR